MLTLLDHSSPKYSPRTYINAEEADLTVAFAIDFTTQGEKLTRKAAGDRYIGISLEGDVAAAANELIRALKQHDARRLNVAGNGIYTLDKQGWTQSQVNTFVHEVLSRTHAVWPLVQVRSGGQTGIDMAGLIAAEALGIDALGFFPNGFIQRGTDTIDRPHTREAIRAQVAAGVAALATKAEMAASGHGENSSDGEVEESPSPDEADAIKEFQGEYRWLSNFWPAKVVLDGVIYPSVENAYQAAKTHPWRRAPYRECSAAQAKKLSHEIEVRSGWDADEKVAVMRALIEQKFAPDSALAKKLVATGARRLVEGNTWGDRFWGVCRGTGQNMLGKLIMERRTALMGLVDEATAKEGQPAAEGSVRVVSKRQGGVRPEPGETVLDGDRKNPVYGNRHYLKDWKDRDERIAVIERHLIEDFEPDVIKGGPLYRAMEKDAERVKRGEKLAIACWCAPLRCHCDHIADGIRKLAAGIDLQAEVRRNVQHRTSMQSSGAPSPKGESGASAPTSATTRGEAGSPASGGYTFFFGPRNPLSNWHAVSFKADGQRFRNNEQYMMWRKARLFGDEDVAKRILLAGTPKEAKALGREVRGFVQAVWDANCEAIVEEGAFEKFSQNEAAREFLLATDDTVLVEASPYDKIWGVGLSADDPRIQDPAQWKGENRLGPVLERVRERLRVEARLDDAVEFFEERAGVFEFEAGAPRIKAEEAALKETYAKFGRAVAKRIYDERIKPTLAPASDTVSTVSRPRVAA